MEKKAQILGFALLSFFTCCAPALFAAPPALDISLSDPAPYPDQSVTLTLRIYWPTAEGEYKFIVPNVGTQNLEMIRRGESRESFKREGELWQAKSFVFEFKAKESGQAEISSFAIQAIHPESTDLFFLDIPIQYIQVKTPFLKSRAFIVLCSSAFALFTFIVLFFTFRRKKTRIAAEKLASITEEERKISLLKQMIDDETSEAEILLNNAVNELKAYLAYRYQIDSFQSSDKSILSALKDRAVEYREITYIDEVLDKSHKVKYAGEELSLREAKAIGNKIIAFIESKKVVGRAD